MTSFIVFAGLSEKDRNSLQYCPCPFNNYWSRMEGKIQIWAVVTYKSWGNQWAYQDLPDSHCSLYNPSVLYLPVKVIIILTVIPIWYQVFRVHFYTFVLASFLQFSSVYLFLQDNLCAVSILLSTAVSPENKLYNKTLVYNHAICSFRLELGVVVFLPKW